MWLSLVILFVGLIWFYLKTKFSYWKNRSVDTGDFSYLGGHLKEQLLFRKHSGDIIQEQYKAFDGYNYSGFYNMFQPTLIVRNPEIIGNILTKDFGSFADNDFEVDKKADPIFGRNPFILNGQEWKNARTQATPTFSSGKIKMMLPLINETSIKLLDYMKNHENTPIDVTELTQKVTAENVASCAFGLNGRCFIDDKPKFVEIASEPIKPSTKNVIKTLIILIFPALGRIIKTGFFSRESIDYLGSIIKETMTYREANNVHRNDLLEEMKRLREKINDDKVFGFDNILGHAGGFLLDGVISTALTASHLLYELAKNQDTQDLLRREIEDVLQNNELTYEKLNELEYLECMIKENLRLHPIVVSLIKRNTKSYDMGPMREGSTGPKVILSPGDVAIIPVLPLHLDEKYYPEPEKFQPNRWKRENQDNLVKNTFLPFGDGPRACLGMRFAMLQLKMMMVAFVKNYMVTVSSKTQEPIKRDPRNFLNSPKGGYWLKFSKIEA